MADETSERSGRSGGGRNASRSTGSRGAKGRKGPGAVSGQPGRLPPHKFAEARTLAEKSGIPLAAAVRVVQGVATMAQTVQALQQRDRLESLTREGKLLKGMAAQIIEGRLPLEQALLLTRLGHVKHAADYMKCHFADFAAAGKAAGVALVGRRILYGTVLEDQKFDVRLKPADGDEVVLHKHDIKFYFDASRKKHVLKQVAWGTSADPLVEDHLRRVKHRVDVKAVVYFAAMEAGRAIRWESAEGDLVRGKVVFLGRYEVVLESPSGDRLVVLRHAVRKVE